MALREASISVVRFKVFALARSALVISILAPIAAASLTAQQIDQASVIRGIDAAVRARVNSIAGYAVTEHYAVYRGEDETHSVADMTVKTVYRKETGKSYKIISQGGSAMIRSLGLDPILQREKEINLPGNVEHSWITSANYEMTLKPGSIQLLDGRNCLVLAINPKRKAPNLIIGTIWVDAKDYTIVRLEGIASKAPSVFAGATHMMRQYANIDGFAMATHARAESSTFLYGRTVVKIDYSGYSIQFRQPDSTPPESLGPQPTTNATRDKP
ncbi:MAG: hypothetical protein WAM85_05020 [Terracidiphilus sp.]